MEKKNLLVRTLIKLVQNYNKKEVKKRFKELYNFKFILILFFMYLGGVYFMVTLPTERENPEEVLTVILTIMSLGIGFLIWNIYYTSINSPHSVQELINKDMDKFTEEEQIMIDIIINSKMLFIFKKHFQTKKEEFSYKQFLMAIDSYVLSSPEGMNAYIKFYSEEKLEDLSNADILIHSLISLRRAYFPREKEIMDLIMEDIEPSVFVHFFEEAVTGNKVLGYFKTLEEDKVLSMIEVCVKETHQDVFKSNYKLMLEGAKYED